MRLRLDTDARPQGHPRPRAVRRGAFVQVYQERTAFFEAVREAGERASEGIAPLTGPLEVLICLKFRRGKTVKREMPTTKPDADNCAKSVLDALNGLWYKDDSQVVRLNITKDYDNDDGCTVILETL